MLRNLRTNGQIRHCCGRRLLSKIFDVPEAHNSVALDSTILSNVWTAIGVERGKTGLFEALAPKTLPYVSTECVW